MKSRLKNLYKHLIENHKHELKGWHDAYREFYEQVGQIRERIKSGKELSPSDEIFLKQLIFERSNGIASRGQSVLSNENFDGFIKNKDFIAILQQFILNPNREELKSLSAHGQNMGSLIILFLSIA